MRVLLVNKFWYRRGGAEAVAFVHDRLLRERGHEVAHFSMRDPRNLESPWQRFFVRRVDYDEPGLRALVRPFYSREVERNVRALVREFRPDVALLHNVYHQLGATVLTALDTLGVPTVMMLHDYKPVCPSYTMMRDGQLCSDCRGGRFSAAARHGCGGSRARGIVFAAEAHWQWHALGTYQRVARYLGPSRYLIERFQDMGFPFAIDWLPNPAPPPSESSSAIEERARADVSAPSDSSPAIEARARGDVPRSTVVGFSGRVSRDKGVHLLLQLAGARPDVRFEIAGDGPEAAELRTAAPANVAWLGWLEPDALARVMGAWNVAVVPSVWPENASMVVLEAMALGVPLVVTDRGGTPELVGDGALVVPPAASDLGAAVDRLLANPALAADLGRRARERARTAFSESRVAERLESILREIPSGRRGGTGRRGRSGRGS